MTLDNPLGGLHETWVCAESDRLARRSVDRGDGAAAQSRTMSLEWIAIPDLEARQPLAATVASYGAVEAEYAALRRGGALIDWAQRGVIRVRGSDRRAFLQRLLTQDMARLASGTSIQAFLLNRKGRIEGDLLLTESGEEIVGVLALPCAEPVAAALAEFVFSDDVSIQNTSESDCVIGLAGPAAGVVAAGVSPPTGCVSLPDPTVGVAARALVLSRADAPAAWSALLKNSEPGTDGVRRSRPVGWHALNVLRIEESIPQHLIDFGLESLPNETGLMDTRVSFSKGCYVGQEIVARLHSRGRPKQLLVRLEFTAEQLPSAGEHVHALVAGSPGEVVGVVTSSAPSLLAGGAPLALATVKSSHARVWTELAVAAEGAFVTARVASGLGAQS